MSNNPKCEQKKFDCFAFFQGRCTILNDTLFLNKDCPFYKTSNIHNVEDKSQEKNKIKEEN